MCIRDSLFSRCLVTIFLQQHFSLFLLQLLSWLFHSFSCLSRGRREALNVLDQIEIMSYNADLINIRRWISQYRLVLTKFVNSFVVSSPPMSFVFLFSFSKPYI